MSSIEWRDGFVDGLTHAAGLIELRLEVFGDAMTPEQRAVLKDAMDAIVEEAQK